ncbi:predicted protein [Histoplasma capsulatum H143]|uniref:Uncharacterized protein n=1 Tax=Ajellomyces capsulatus (strain H143) TaxID=544712 RepID=C6H2V5_AJECH|nr:predicted protein [Histoplasma capsulatum H143]
MVIHRRGGTVDPASCSGRESRPQGEAITVDCQKPLGFEALKTKEMVSKEKKQSPLRNFNQDLLISWVGKLVPVMQRQLNQYEDKSTFCGVHAAVSWLKDALHTHDLEQSTFFGTSAIHVKGNEGRSLGLIRARGDISLMASEPWRGFDQQWYHLAGKEKPDYDEGPPSQ